MAYWGGLKAQLELELLDTMNNVLFSKLFSLCKRKANMRNITIELFAKDKLL